MLTLVLLVVMAFAKSVKPDFYNRFFEKTTSLEPGYDGSEPNSQPISEVQNNTNINSNDNTLCSGRQTCAAKVTRVVDGDTIDLSNGERVRYIGINTPETEHPTKRLSALAKKPPRKIGSWFWTKKFI